MGLTSPMIDQNNMINGTFKFIWDMGGLLMWNEMAIGIANEVAITTTPHNKNFFHQCRRRPILKPSLTVGMDRDAQPFFFVPRRVRADSPSLRGRFLTWHGLLRVSTGYELKFERGANCSVFVERGANCSMSASTSPARTALLWNMTCFSDIGRNCIVPK